MNKKFLVSVVAIPMALSCWASSFAQDEEDKPPYVTPVDTYTCSYNDGKGPADLKKAIADWNDWMDDQDADDYGAFVLTPFYFGADTFELGWLGYWTTQEGMGTGIDNYLSNGADAAQGFNEVLTCQTHEHWAAVNIKPPPEGGAPENFVMMFSNCTRKDGVEYKELFETIDKAVAYQDENGYTNGSWFMWQVFGGGGDTDWDFKAIDTWENYAAFGKAYQHNANGGGRQAMNEIMGDQLVCDASRVYNAKAVRRPAEGDGE